MPLGEIHHEVESHFPRMEMTHDTGSQEYKFRLALTDETPTFVISHHDSDYEDFIQFNGSTKTLKLGTEGAEEVKIGSSDTDVNLAGTVAFSGSFANSDVSIDGGAIDGTTIGATTSAAGTFTTLEATGTFTTGDNSTLAGTTTVSTLTDGIASLTTGAFTGKSLTIDPQSAAGEAIVVSNTGVTQTSGALVKITGLAEQTAFEIVAGEAHLQHVSVDSITTQSDRRIKENIQEHDPQETHTNVMKLKGVDYNLIADERKSKNTGFVAQEVEEVFPQFVKEDKDGMKSVNYSQMTAVLLSALQHQNTLIEKLTARIEVLESQ